MKRLILVAMLVAGCGGTEQQSPTLDADAGIPTDASICATNLDAGTPCDPCPGATTHEQIDHFSPIDGTLVWTQRICGCPVLPDGGAGNYMSWQSCPQKDSCATLQAFWNDLCHR